MTETTRVRAGRDPTLHTSISDEWLINHMDVWGLIYSRQTRYGIVLYIELDITSRINRLNSATEYIERN